MMHKQETGVSNPNVNFADEILHVENLVKSRELVQRVIFGKDKGGYMSHSLSRV